MSHTASSATAVIQLGQGYTWEQLHPGMRLRTFGRTVTEADLVGFINVTGMLETLFIDTTWDGAMRGRPVPGALTYTLIEGLILQSMIQGTGLAMLELTQTIEAPVCVGDTVHGEIEVTAIRPTSRHNRAVVTSRIDVMNQAGQRVMTYTATRLLAGAAATPA
ncbi:MaoC family dehydratase [Achromobacter sp. GG226]|uniref:MaoC family dehydratase n=1 Tax=Verticiella alkaliphila TaxID=2779529 RepID=UPI001C0CF109|nr:MaoC family dehydratase [Verticiella sp. GG226]MBU4610383.1 MaoC family dehydratase [Verticiella sp. GG226]